MIPTLLVGSGCSRILEKEKKKHREIKLREWGKCSYLRGFYGTAENYICTIACWVSLALLNKYTHIHEAVQWELKSANDEKKKENFVVN